MSVTGLEGGCVANGSTCGIASGGALGIALLNEHLLMQGETNGDEAVLITAGKYMEWFDKTYSTTQCRERNNVDFHSVMGQLKYFLSAHKIIRCMLMAGGALNHLTLNNHLLLNGQDVGEQETEMQPVHCAQEVLKLIRKKTGTGNDRLERLSIVFDGGIGLKGRLCGAVAGSVLALNLVHGFNLREMGYRTNVKKFIIGHINLMRKSPGESPKRTLDTFAIGKDVVNQFKDAAGSIECQHITGVEFDSPKAFQEFMATSERCRHLIHVSADIASKAILDNKRSADNL
jgi:C_GCAxxG_C_C family probable redox protein